MLSVKVLVASALCLAHQCSCILVRVRKPSAPRCTIVDCNFRLVAFLPELGFVSASGSVFRFGAIIDWNEE